MNKKLITLSIVSILLVLPIFTLAINPIDQPQRGTFDIATAIDNIFGFIWPIFIAFAVLMFIFAGFLFLTAQGDPTKISSAKKALIWGIIGVAVGILSSSIPFIINGIL